jgi:hypothetical protein
VRDACLRQLLHEHKTLHNIWTSWRMRIWVLRHFELRLTAGKCNSVTTLGREEELGQTAVYIHDGPSISPSSYVEPTIPRIATTFSGHPDSIPLLSPAKPIQNIVLHFPPLKNPLNPAPKPDRHSRQSYRPLAPTIRTCACMT